MKILRVRRGFTTNSSGANEYLSPSKGRDWGPRGRPDGGAPVPAYPYPVNLDAGAGVRQPAPTSGSHGSAGGAYVIGLLALIALLLFVVERIVGFGLRKKRKRDEPDPD